MQTIIIVGIASLIPGLGLLILRKWLSGFLVLYIFMHLRYEERIFKTILFAVIATLTVIMGLTFLDVGYR